MANKRKIVKRSKKSSYAENSKRLNEIRRKRRKLTNEVRPGVMQAIFENKEKVKLFFSNVEQRPHLWQPTHPGYNLGDSDAWLEICEAVKDDYDFSRPDDNSNWAEVLKYEWKAIMDQYRAALEYTTKYDYEEYLEFVKEVLMTPIVKKTKAKINYNVLEEVNVEVEKNELTIKHEENKVKIEIECGELDKDNSCGGDDAITDEDCNNRQLRKRVKTKVKKTKQRDNLSTVSYDPAANRISGNPSSSLFGNSFNVNLIEDGEMVFLLVDKE